MEKAKIKFLLTDNEPKMKANFPESIPVKTRYEIIEELQDVMVNYFGAIPFREKFFKWQITERMREALSGKSKSHIAQMKEKEEVRLSRLMELDLGREDVECEIIKVIKED